MELKQKVENFKNQENELKIELLKEIRKEFNNYEKDTVFFHPNCEYEEAEELWDECNLFGLGNPFIMDKYCQIDGTAQPSYIKNEDDELRLYCRGESGYLEFTFTSLDQPSWEMTVEFLFGLLQLLREPLIKKINQQ